MTKISVSKVAPGKNDSPFPPYVYICLSRWPRDSEGIIHLSPHLMTDTEIDESIDYLISQLDKARKKAKKDLKEAKERLRAGW